MTRKNQFNPVDFDPNMKGETVTTATEDEKDIDREEVDASMEELKKLRDLKNITLGWRKKFAQSQARTAKAKAKFDEADAARKQAKAGVDRAVADELALVARFTHGEQLLPYDQEEDSAAKQQPGNQPSLPLGTDEGAASPITVLLSKELKKIVGKDVFDSSKERSEPIGFTEKGIEPLLSQGWDTIGKLEQAMRDDSHWFDKLKGFGETKINQLINSLHAFRKVHPHPEESTEGEPADETANDWQQAVADLDRIVRISWQLVSDGPREAIEFAKSVGIEAIDMRKGIEAAESATDNQLTAIANWTEGLEKWQQPAAK